MIDINKTYKTREGLPVLHLHRAPEGWPGDNPWRGIVGSLECSWTDDGKYDEDSGYDDMDLIEAKPEPRRFKIAVPTALGVAERGFEPGKAYSAEEDDDPKYWEHIDVVEVLPTEPTRRQPPEGTPAPPDGFEFFGYGPLPRQASDHEISDVAAITPGHLHDDWETDMSGASRRLLYALRIGTPIHESCFPKP